MMMNNELVMRYYNAALKRPERIRSRREQLKLTQPELSKLTGITRENIVKSEKGQVIADGSRRPYRPKILPMCQLAVALKTTPAWLEYGVFSIESFDTELKYLTERLQEISISERKEVIFKINQFLNKIGH